MPEQIFRIHGKVIDRTTRKGLPGLRVAAWDRDLVEDDSLGEALTDARGRFRISFDHDRFSEWGLDTRPDLYFKVFDGESLLYSSGEQPVRDWQPGRGPLVIEVDAPPTPAVDNRFVVEGEVVEPDGTPLPNYPVRAFDRALCNWRLLGEARTDDRGRYRIAYDPARLEAWGKTRADLKAEVYDPQTGDGVLAASPLFLQAMPHETVNFAVGKGAYRGPDEYSRAHRSLAPLLRSVDDLGCLEVADVRILARDSGLPNSSVAYYLKARRWAGELDAPPAVFYGLLRQHQPSRKDALLARPFPRLWDALKQAGAQNLINLPLDEALRARLMGIQQSYLARPDHPYRRLLRTTSLRDKQQAVFTQRLTTWSGGREDFWATLETEAGFGAEQVADLRGAFELQSLTGDNTSLTIRLRDTRRALRPREAAALSVEDWREVLSADGVTIPDDVLPGEPEVVRRASYAQALYRSAEALNPTPALTARMGRSEIWAGHGVSAFLNAYPDFEFEARRVTPFLRANPEALNLFPDGEAGKGELLRFEQLFHLTPAEDKLAAIQPLWDAGLRSAPQIAAAGRQQLQRRAGDQLSRQAVNQIYQKAVHTTAVALNVYMRYNPRLNSPSLYALNTPALPPDQSLAAAAGLPEWTELFGSADACECRHCESTLSPAAYLVDMMDFLRRAGDGSGKNGLDYLLERRPDLGLLELTCENSETTLPQIDLVIEIMEQLVAHSADGRTLPAAGEEQTTWDSELLAAQPEHLLPAAYEKLQSAAYPFPQLPFSLWLEEGRRYLRQMGVARDELMRVMPALPESDEVAVAAEALGLSSAEREIITTPLRRAADLAPYWGVDLADGSLVSQLVEVKSFLAKAQIDYDGLLRLLNTRFLNPGRLIAVEFEGAPCSLDGAGLKGTDPLTFVDRTHRFLRLLRRLGWTEYELDAAIRAINANDFDDEGFIPRLAAVKSLGEGLGLPASELSAWWGDLDTFVFEDGLASQYEAIFLNPSVFPDTHTGAGPDLRNEVFALTADRSDLAVTASTDPNLSKWLAESDGAEEPTYELQQDYATYIQSATRLTAADIALLVAEDLPRDAAGGNVALNLSNVSRLYRVASFTRALGIGVRDYLHLVNLTGLSPLTAPGAPASPLESEAAHARLSEIDQGEWEIAELSYLLLHDAEAAATYAPRTEDVAEVLAGLSAGLAGVTDVATARDNAELKTALTQSLGATLGVEAETIEALLFTHRVELGDDLLQNLIDAANPELTPPTPTPPDFYNVYETLHKFSLAWKGLKLDPSHLAFVLDEGPALGWTDVTAFPLEELSATDFEAWRRLTGAAGLQASVFTAEQSLFALLAEAKAATLTREAFLAQTADRTGWGLDDLTYLAGPDGLNLAYPTDFRDAQWLVALERVFALLRPLGVSAAQAHRWTLPVLTSAEAESIKQALKLAYDSDAWLQALAGIQDELRPLKRDALLGSVLSNFPSDDSSDFYRHYLIDPEMAPCALTSRIVEAHAAVQLFVQRILLNLEPPLAFPREDAEGWQWRKNYRVWEAARKVFLYPENWLEPELRDNKSVFFRELEDGLLQDEATPATAERLYREYLYKLDQASRLEIVGMYEDAWVDQDVERKVLHVFGRTRDIPHQYHYRRWEDQARWTPWEPVPLDIQGDHLTPVVYNARLYLFWPTFTLTPIEPDTSKLDEDIAELKAEIDEYEELVEAYEEQIADYGSVPGVGQTLETSKAIVEASLQSAKDQKQAKNEEKDELIANTPANKVELSMVWSSYADGRWSPKHLAASGPDPLETDFRPKDFYFTGWVTRDNRLHLAVRGERTVEVVTETTAVGPPVLMRTPVPNATQYNPPATSVEKIDVGYYYFDDCQSELLFVTDVNLAPYTDSLVPASGLSLGLSLRAARGPVSMAAMPVSASVGAAMPVSAPVGEVKVADSKQSFDSRKLNGVTLSLEIGTGDPRETRPLLDSAGFEAKVLHAHQYGPDGGELSPFFYADDLRTYFVQPVTQIAGLPRAGLSGVALSGQEAAASAAREAPAVTFEMPAGQIGTSAAHYQGSANELIIDRADTQPNVPIKYGESDAIGGILAEGPALNAVPGEVTRPAQVIYRFTRFYHPHTCLFLKQLSRHGVGGLLSPDPDRNDDSENLHRQLTPLEDFDFGAEYGPTDWVAQVRPDEEIDFDHHAPYGSYNWETFFHIPLLIATRLMQNQRFAEARSWFHHIFDPTYTEGEPPARFWKIKPFYEEQLKGPTETLQELLDLLEAGSEELEQQVEEWEQDPFQPHVIARLRITAYMQTTVMKYLDCLIGEADMLFAADTRESINEAAQLYLLAQEILGERPTLLPPQEAAAHTPNLLLGPPGVSTGVGSFNDPLESLTALLPSTLPGRPTARANPGVLPGVAVSTQGAATGYGTLLLFCIPHNDKLYAYWDTVADRLFKIRHCMNIAGRVRQLPLFAPPIDPGLLVRASAAGLDIASIVANLYAPLPNYRFGFMLQKALEFCGEVRSLGGALLAALEKRDGEKLSLVRAEHEAGLLEAIRSLKQKNVEEADSSLAGLLKSKESAEFRAEYYSNLERVSSGEQKSLDKQEGSRQWQAASEIAETTASIYYAIPETTIGFDGVKVSFGGIHLGGISQAVASFSRARAAALAYESNKAGTMAGYDRRLKDWRFQSDLAGKEIEQLDKQILAAEIRKAIAEADLENHEKQIAQAQEVEEFLKLKFTGEQLYVWTASKLSSLYFQAYQTAYRIAKQAEKTFQHELGPDESGLTFIQPTYWDSLRKGLLAGEHLHQDLRRMEAAHLDAHRRELEITKHVSLFQLDPAALLKLRETGGCDFHIPEVFFDMDFAGHYYRRVKAVRLTIPCVTGPYASASATLSLTNSWIRKAAEADGDPEPVSIAPSQAAIATSSAREDGGTFELNFNDPRYLPFEGAGAVSSWRLELPSAVRPFDYDTITDVVVHLSYTARDGGDDFKQDVNGRLESGLNDLKKLLAESGATLSRLFSLRQEFSADWNRFLSPLEGEEQRVTLNLSKQHFPRYSDYMWEKNTDGIPEPHPITLQITSVRVYLNPRGAAPPDAAGVRLNGELPAGVSDIPGLLLFDSVSGLSATEISNESGAELTLTVSDAQLRPEDWKDMYVLLHYEVKTD